MLEGMKKSSESYWTESVVSEEITEEDFLKTREVAFEPEITTTKKVRAKKSDKPEKPVELEPEKTTGRKKIVKPKMASLENFFEGVEPAPENKKSKKRVWPGGAFLANASPHGPHPMANSQLPAKKRTPKRPKAHQPLLNLKLLPPTE